jgi:hypothetical protein
MAKLKRDLFQSNKITCLYQRYGNANSRRLYPRKDPEKVVIIQMLEKDVAIF